MRKLTAHILLLSLFLGLSTRGSQSQEGVSKKRHADKLQGAVALAADEDDDAGAVRKAKELGLRVLGDGEKGEVVVLLESAAGGGRAIDADLVAKLGGQVLAVSDSYVRVQAPPRTLRRLATHPGVRVVRAPTAATPLDTGFGTLKSESVALTGAAELQNSGLVGAGVKVAVVDLGFAGLTDIIGFGELPADTTRVVLPGQPGEWYLEYGTPHGTGVAEHLMDMAPGAKLHCIRVDDELDLENAASYLAANGIRIANHSVGWVNASYYDGTGPINSIFNSSYNGGAGVFWAVAAGNDAQRHWRGGWTDTNGNRWLNFNGTADETLDLTGNAGAVYLFLNWNRYPATSTDLDLYVYNRFNQLVVRSTLWQTGSQPPTESVSFNYDPAQAPYQVKVNYWSGPTAGVDLTLFCFTHVFQADLRVAASSLMDPANAPGAFSVAAINQLDYGLAAPPPEYFSSQGPTTDNRQKPDLAAPDGTTSWVYGIQASFGTSFSSPTTAGAAALLLGEDSTRTAGDVASLLRAKTIPIAGVSGWSPLYGFGKLSVGAPPTMPEAAITQPTAGATVSDSVEVLVQASDAQDPAGSLAVDVRVDSGIWMPTSYDALIDRYRVLWDSTTATNGAHTLTARARNSRGLTGGAPPVAVTVSNALPPPPAGPIAVDRFDTISWSGGTGWDGPWQAPTGVGEAVVTDFSGAYSAPYHVLLRSSTGYMRRAVRLSGQTTVRVRFAAKVAQFEGQDAAVVRVSPNGSSWTTIKSFGVAQNDNTYHFFDIPVDVSGAAYVASGKLHLLFDSNVSSVNDWWFIDDVEVSN